MLLDCTKLKEFDSLLTANEARLMVEVNGVSTVPDVKYRPQTFEVYDPRKRYNIDFLRPNTTTLVDIILNREQSDRMVVLRNCDFQPLRRPAEAKKEKPTFGGRAQLLKGE